MDKLGVSDNTLVVFMADNGLMYHYEGTSGLNQLIYRGGKTDFTEGGIRVDAFVRWPGVIEPGSVAGDIVHVSDLFTTFARVGQAEQHIPRDRVIDGIDQTPLLLKGEATGAATTSTSTRTRCCAPSSSRSSRCTCPRRACPRRGAGSTTSTAIRARSTRRSVTRSGPARASRTWSSAT